MRISIITISFNQAEFLERNRTSVRNQIGDVEHIIVDPGSTDGSREIIANWAREDSSVIPVFEPDSGPAHGLNNGLRRVTGDIWLYLNADDELAPAATEKIVASHEAQPDSDVLISGGWTIDAEGRPLLRIRSDRFSPARYAMNVGTVLQQGTSFKTSRTLPGTQFNIANRMNWDTELLFDLFRAGKRFGYSDDVVGYFRLQPASITMSGAYEERLLAERSRLRATVRAHRVLAALSPLARAIKAARSRTRAADTFPGLVDA